MRRILPVILTTLSCFAFQSEAQIRNINTIAGSGTSGYSGDGHSAVAADLKGPFNVAFDKTGNVYVVDYYNNRVRKVKTDGTIATLAGTGSTGFSGNGSYAASANMEPWGVAVDARGNVYISEANNSVVRKVNTLGIISAFAGTGTYGNDGDGRAAVNAKLSHPMGLAVDEKSNVFIADAGAHCIRKVDTFGTISTVAGSGVAGYGGDLGSALAAKLDSPYGVAVDRLNNIYIADRNNHIIRFVDNTHTIYTIAGTPNTHGYSGDSTQAISATLFYPTSVAVDTDLNIFIADAYNNVIRMVDVSGKITTVGGNGWAGYGGDLGPAIGANLFHPYGVAADKNGNVFVADANNQRVRKIYWGYPASVISASKSGIEIFPNPVKNELFLNGVAANDKVEIIAMSGSIVSTTTIAVAGTTSISTENLTAGLYIVRVLDESGNLKTAVKVTK